MCAPSRALAEDAYIEASGKQAINTGYCVNDKTRIVADFQVTDAEKNQAPVFGAFDSTGMQCGFWVNYGKNPEAKLGTWGGRFATGADTLRRIVTIDVPSRTATYGVYGDDSATVTKTGFTASGEADMPLYLFASYKDGYFCHGTCRIYSFTIWEDGEVVHEFLPATKGGDIGFYDTVGKTFHGNGHAPYAALTHGGDLLEIEDDAYISTEGNDVTAGGFYIDTETFATDKTKIALDYALADDYTGTSSANKDWYVFSGGANAANSRLNYFYNQGGIGCSSSGANWWYVDQTKFPNPASERNVRRTVVWDGPAATLSIITAGITNSVEVAQSGAEAPYGANTVKIAAGFSGQSSFAPLKIYSLRIWEDGVEKHSYRPCILDGKAGLRDELPGRTFLPTRRYADSASSVVAGQSGGAIASERDDAYIVCTVAKGISTGYRMNAASRVELDAALPYGYAGAPRPMGCWQNASTMRYLVYVSNRENQFFLNKASKSGGTMAADSARHTWVFDAKNNCGVYITGVTTNETVTGEKPAEGAVSNFPLSIFADSNNATGTGWTGAVKGMKCYGLKIYENDQLVTNFVPYVKSSGAVVGFRDTITGAFLEADGTCFAAGGNVNLEGVSKDAYLESDQTQYLDTGYKVKHGSVITVDYAYRSFSGSNPSVFGVQQDSAPKLYGLLYSGTVAIGDSWGTKSLQGNTDFDRHTVTLDYTGDRAAWRFSTDGVETSGTLATATTRTADISLALFADHFTTDGSETVKWPAACRIYSVRIYDGGDMVNPVHEFLPCVSGGVATMYDTKTGAALEVKALPDKTASAFGYGGMGADGAERWLVKPLSRTLKKGASATISASAVGAVAYRWTKNGVAVEEAASGSIAVAWARGGATDTYTVTALYSVFGSETVGAPVTFTVEHLKPGTVLIVR